jgi:hypothetical protein
MPVQGDTIDPAEEIRVGEVLFDGDDTQLRTHHGTFRPR